MSQRILPSNHRLSRSEYNFYLTLQQVRNQLGTLRGEEFSEGHKFLKPCPTVLKYVQQIFPGGEKNFPGAASPPLVTGLRMKKGPNFRSWEILAKTEIAL